MAGGSRPELSGVQHVQAGGDPVLQAPGRPGLDQVRVRVNTVSPGPVETPILSDFEQTMGKDVLDMCRATPVGTRPSTTLRR
jgi:NAD(P)-dependent dehydrogenase (short-subunit alcohol dehydrogenase family)